MPHLATPAALDNSTHSSSTDTHSRAKRNTPAPTPSTVPAICGERDDEPCSLLGPGPRGRARGFPAPGVQGVQTNTASPASVWGISHDWCVRPLAMSSLRGLNRNHTFRTNPPFLGRTERLLSALGGSFQIRYLSSFVFPQPVAGRSTLP